MKIKYKGLIESILNDKPSEANMFLESILKKKSKKFLKKKKKEAGKNFCKPCNHDDDMDDDDKDDDDNEGNINSDAD